MTEMVDIYGLFDPDTGDMRYVGKAKKCNERFVRHLQEARTEDRPVHRWIRKLASVRNLPTLQLLECVPVSEWEQAEKRWIAFHRKGCDLLNLADGGNLPSMTKAQRIKSGYAMNLKIQAHHPQQREFILAKSMLARFATRLKRDGDILEYWCMKFNMHARAVKRPDLYPTWLFDERFINR